MLEYFGDETDRDCGNCDNCLRPPATWDGSEAARKLLSAVYRTGQTFGAAHVVDVLLGKATEKVMQHGHARLSVFGIGAELGAQAWRSAIRQLIVHGYLRADPQRFGALVLTEASRPLLRGEVALQLREESKGPLPRKKPRAVKSVLSDKDHDLWDALRACRQRLAAEHNVPPYVIFHDATLLQMLERKPATLPALLDISGVGQAKLERYGDEFIEVILSAG
jgi:ATP-dependent DNA helicase RecQ